MISTGLRLPVCTLLSSCYLSVTWFLLTCSAGAFSKDALPNRYSKTYKDQINENAIGPTQYSTCNNCNYLPVQESQSVSTAFSKQGLWTFYLPPWGWGYLNTGSPYYFLYANVINNDRTRYHAKEGDFDDDRYRTYCTVPTSVN
jgi:hypothetical protein